MKIDKKAEGGQKQIKKEKKTHLASLAYFSNTNAFNFLARGPLTLPSPRRGEG